MALLTPPSLIRSQAPAWVEEPHFEPSAIRRAIQDIEPAAARPWSSRKAVRSDLPGFRVADARRALAGLPSPGDYRIVIKPLRYRKRPHLSGLWEFDVGRIIVRIPEPFRPFDELVYFNARRK